MSNFIGDLFGFAEFYINTSLKNTHDREDMKQECVCLMLSMVEKYNPEDSKFTLIFKVAVRNMVRKFIRKERRNVPNGVRFICDRPYRTKFSDMDVRIVCERLRSKLDDRGRVVLGMLEQECTTSEISAEIGVSRVQAWRTVNCIGKEIEDAVYKN